MMLQRRSVRDSASTNTRSVSQAQYQSALAGHPRRSPANRLTRSTSSASIASTSKSPSASFDRSYYSQYENASSSSVVLPPVFKTPAAVRPLSASSATTPRRSTSATTKRGSRKLPTVERNPGGHRLAWYHQDGSLNLQALNTLALKHSFPGSQSFFDRLANIHNNNRPAGPPRSARGGSSDDSGLLALPFMYDEDDDDHLTPRHREERDSLLHLLLHSEDLTGEELEQLVKYISEKPSSQPTTPRSCLRKPSSSRPKSAAAVEKRKKKRSKEVGGSQGNLRSKSVRFQRQSFPTGVDASESVRLQGSLPVTPRPHSAPSPRTHSSYSPLSVFRKSSGPFHVASPATMSPRALVSPDEVAYFTGYDSTPEIPASPEPPIPEPKVTFYDESGEEIEEDIQKDQSVAESKVEDQAPPCEEEDTPRADKPPPAESSKREESQSPEPEADHDPQEHLPELDTPRLNRDIVNNQEPPQCGESEALDSPTPRPVGHSISESTDSAQQTLTPRAESPREEDPVTKQCEDAPLKVGQELPSPPKEDEHDKENKKPESPPPEKTPPEYAPAEQSSAQKSKKSRPKSSKRPKSSRSRSKSANQVPQPPQPDAEDEHNSNKPLQSLNALPASRPPAERSEPARVEPLPVPVISLTRGQLPAVSPYSPRIESADSPAPEHKDLTDSVEGQVNSPRSSTLQGAESPRGGGRGKDNRMKIWLTLTSWNRPVECVD